ncbi:MAG: hypothetical protein WC784_02320 [Candidatus Shapirobacteria bacterium]|jgi:hypothetical protein
MKIAKIPTSIKIFTPIVFVFILLLLILSFYSGYAWSKLKSTSSKTTTVTTTFAAKKTQKPELKFFVMAFCPYGNQMETILRPIFDLLKNKVDITPHYIFEKVTDLDSTCKNSSGDPAQCAAYVQNKYFTTIAECQKTVTASLALCKDENNYIKSQSGSIYSSLHGRQEANQDVREICAWNQSTDKTQWWNFVANINKNCTAQNADSCWEDQAKSAGLDTTKITECFNKEGINLIEKEIALTTQNNISSSPSLLINNVVFPPQAANVQNGTLKIGDKIANQSQFRTPNVIKAALCASFQKSPNECKTILNDITGTAPAAGGCN